MKTSIETFGKKVNDIAEKEKKKKKNRKRSTNE